MYYIKLKSESNGRLDCYAKFGYDTSYKTWWITAFEDDLENKLHLGNSLRELPTLVSLLNGLNRLGYIFNVSNQTMIDMIIEEKMNMVEEPTNEQQLGWN
jgi:hypothetical protein